MKLSPAPILTCLLFLLLFPLEYSHVGQAAAQGRHDEPARAEEYSIQAISLQMKGKNTKAAALMEKALQIREKILGPDNLEQAIYMINLAWLYYYTGAYDRAEPLFRQALEIREKIFGAEHPDAAAIRRDNAFFHLLRDNVERAMVYFHAISDPGGLACCLPGT